MKRDLEALKQTEFDVVVVGAGVHGACVARDAALRGMRVALIDQGDICGATSHNSLKTIHGGIRYLQHLNLKRTLSSIREQSIWLATAPKRVRPLPFLMPTYGHGMRGPLAMMAGVLLYYLVGLGRNKGLAKASQIKAGRVVSAKRCLSIAKGLPDDGLTGAAIWNDAQVTEADQTVIEIVADACQNGTVAANYLKATDFILAENPSSSQPEVVGVRVADMLSEQTFNIRAACVVNASGPWLMKQIADSSLAEQASEPLPLVKSMNIVTRKSLGNHALSFYSQHQSDSLLGKTKRLFFVVPWKGCSVFGTTHIAHQSEHQANTTIESDITDFVNEINAAYPALDLQADDVLYCYHGLTPADAMEDSKDKSKRLHESKVIDHQAEQAINGLVSIVSIKWTTARLVAEQCTNIVANKFGNTKSCITRTRPIPALDINRSLAELTDEQLKQSVRSHVEHTMVLHLSDLLIRRSDDFILEKLGEHQLGIIVNELADALNWSTDDKLNELANLSNRFLSTRNNTLIQQLRETVT